MLRALNSSLLLAALAGLASSQGLQTEWLSTLDSGSGFGNGLTGFFVDPSGISYVTGTGGPSSNTDVVTGAFAPDGTLIWSQTYNGPENWHDQGRGLTLSPDGSLWVCGNTPGPGKYANVLLLKYRATDGLLLKTIQYSSGSFMSEHGASIAADAAGNVYVGGGTVGDGADGMMLSFTGDGVFRWKRTYDGAAWGPFSQDSIQQVEMDPNGDVVARVHGVAASLHPDYVVIKYAPADGSTIWEASWGSSGEDASSDMEIDATGDIYLTGTGIDGIDKYSTIKLRGTDGQLLWQAWDSAAFRNYGRALALDGQGGVYVTGSVDPDGDQSNFNDDLYSVKRDAATGAFQWDHRYGAACVGCLDVPTDIQADPAGNVFISGSTSSPPYAFVKFTFVLDAGSGAELDFDVTKTGSSGFLLFDAAYNLFNGGSSWNPDTGAVTMSITKHTTLASSPYQLQLDEIVSGANLSIRAANATPFAAQIMAFGLTGTQTTPIAPLATTLGLANPFLLATGSADASGSFGVTIPVPGGAKGATVWLQSLEFGASTPVVKRVIQ